MKAVILFSGGLDSTLMLALALEQGRECFALSFDYNQKHRIELESAKKIAQYYEVEHAILPLTIYGRASLLGNREMVKDRSQESILTTKHSPNYVPARNTLFLAYALGYCESLEAEEIWFGCNAHDSSFPDCSLDYCNAMQKVMDQAICGKKPKLVTPLIQWDKTVISAKAQELAVPVAMTHSCYDPQADKPCGRCDACVIRNAFVKA